MNIIEKINYYIWNIPLVSFILLTGLYLTFKLKGIQFTKIKDSFKALFSKKYDDQAVTTFEAVCISLGATLGAGNIIGVAIAIQIGGPQALIWMIITIILTLPIKYAENYLSSKYRKKTEGGPYIYIEQLPFKSHILSKTYALFCSIASIIGLGTFIQINGVKEAFKNIFQKDFYIKNIFHQEISVISLIIGLVFAILTLLVIIKNIKGLAQTSSFLIVLGVIFYLGLCIITILQNYEQLPNMFKLIFKDFFNLTSCTSGIIGCAIKEGVNKGIFASESGIGSSGIASSLSNENHHKIGLASMGSTLFGTLFICILTGFVVILTKAYQQNINGISIVNYAFMTNSNHQQITSTILFICISIYAFTTIIGWNMYGIKSLQYLTKNPKIIQIYQWIYIMMVFLGAFLETNYIWKLSEIFNGLMIIPNLITIIYLTKKMYKD